MSKSTLQQYTLNIFNQLASKIGRPDVAFDAYMGYRDEEEIVDYIIGMIKKENIDIKFNTHLVGLSEKYVLLPMGYPSRVHLNGVRKQFYYVCHRETFEPVITFRVGYDEFERILELIRGVAIVENSTTVIVASIVVK